MVSCFVGLPGSGKSTLLSYLAFLAINGEKINRRNLHISTVSHYDHVFTNFPTNGAYKLDFEQLGLSSYNDSMIFVTRFSYLLILGTLDSFLIIFHCGSRFIDIFVVIFVIVHRISLLLTSVYVVLQTEFILLKCCHSELYVFGSG